MYRLEGLLVGGCRIDPTSAVGAAGLVSAARVLLVAASQLELGVELLRMVPSVVKGLAFRTCFVESWPGYGACWKPWN
jgi:hypothetical protein